MEILIGAMVFFTVTAAVLAIAMRPGNVAQQRIVAFKDAAFIDEAPPERPPTFIERILRPASRSLLGAVRIVLPETILDKMQWRLTVAGDPITLTTLLVIWISCALGAPAFVYFFSRLNGPLTGQQWMIVGVAAALGVLAPHIWLSGKARRRQQAILKRLPDAIDLLTTSVEAGLGIDAALGQVAQRVKGPLAVEFRRMLREMAVGSVRREALLGFSARVNIPDVKQFVNALVQAEQMGVSLAQVIRVQADQMRLRRRQRAEQLAYKAPVKMVVPLVLFIFPSLFVVILGPAAIQIMEQFGGK